MRNNIENNKNGIRSKTYFNDQHRKCDFQINIENFLYRNSQMWNNIENNKNGIRSKTHFND